MKDSSVFQITAVFSVLLLAVLLTSSAASVEWNAHENNSVTIDQANSTIIWGQNYTFNASELNLYNQTLQINRTNTTENYNISIASNTTEEINSTLHKYNLTDNPELGKTVLKIETEATNNSKVNFSFTGIPGIGSEHYVLRRDGNQVNTFSSGGKVSWSYSKWSSNQNFSLSYEDISAPSISLDVRNSVPEDSSIKIECSSSDVSGIKSKSVKVTGPDGKIYRTECGSKFTEIFESGEYTVKISVTDKSGNTGSVKESFDVTDSDNGGSGGTVDTTPSDSHSWKGVNKKQFKMQDINPEIGVRAIRVQTKENISEFSIEMEKLEDSSSAPEIQNSYTTYSINTSVTDSKIESTTLEFTVDRSFAQQYDRIIVSRYDSNSWNELPTKPVETEGEKWTYQASTNGFSYYAVTGENTETDQQKQQEQNQTTENDTSQQQDEQEGQEQREDEINQERQNAQQTLQNANSTIQQREPGYQLLQQARTAFQNQDYTEAQNLAQQALNQNQQRQEGLPKIIGAATLLIIIISGGYMLYRRKKKKQLNKEVAHLQDKLQKEAKDLELDQPEHTYQLLDQAEQLVKKGKYRKAEKKIEQIEQNL